MQTAGDYKLPVMIHWIPTDLDRDDIAKRYRAVEMIDRGYRETELNGDTDSRGGRVREIGANIMNICA